MSKRQNTAVLTLLGALLVAIATWPACLGLGTHAYEPLQHPDVQVGLWWPSHFADSLLSAQNPFHPSGLAWPHGQDIRLLLWNCGAQLLFLPLHLWTGPLLGMNLSTLLILWLNGLACAWVARRLGADAWVTLAALCVGCTSAYSFHEGGSGRPEQALWAPVVLYLGSMASLWNQPSRTMRWVAGASLAAAGAVYWFHAYFLLILTALLFVLAVLSRTLNRRRIVDLAWVAGISLVLVLPFLLPIVDALTDGGSLYGGMLEAAPTKIQIRRTLLPTRMAGGFLGDGDPSHRLPLLCLPVLLHAAVRARGGLRGVAFAGLGAALFAAGPELMTSVYRESALSESRLPLPGALLEFLPGYERFWWPYRWSAVTLAASGVLVGWSLQQLARPRKWALLFLLVSTADCMVMLRGGPILDRPLHQPARVPDLVHALGAVPSPAPLLQLPLGRLPSGGLVWTAWHHQPIDGGIAWSMHPARGEGYAQRLREVPLLAALAGNTLPSPIPGRGEPWTAEEAGGFHYVIFFVPPESQEKGPVSRPSPHLQEVAEVSELLGDPFYSDADFVAWTVPGLGEVPPATW